MLCSQLSSLLLVVCAFATLGSAEYKAASPPDTITLGWPSSDLTVGVPITVGFEGGGEAVSANFYGFAWNTSVSLQFPNGTKWTLLYAPSGNQCSGSGGTWVGSSADAKTIGSSATSNPTTDTGLYSAIWNVTYGTTTNSSVANQTFCDVSQLSYQTWLFARNFSVVPASPGGGKLTPTLTKAVETFVPRPTGSIMVSNEADTLAVRKTFMLLGLLCSAMWHML